MAKRFLRVVVLFLLFSGLVISAPFYKATAYAMPSLRLPMLGSYTWYVCQGYNTPAPGDHNSSTNAYYAVDLVPAANSAGSWGCINNPNAATSIPLVAPAAGTIYQVGPDLECINFDAGGSMLIGHLTGRPSGGSHINAGYPIGVVEPPVNNGWQGNFAHVHLQAFSGSGCGWAQNVPLTGWARIVGMRDLPDKGGTTQYQGQVVRFPGDANGDGGVDLTDLSMLSSAWGQTGSPNFSPADFNGDGRVDLTDLSILSSYWGQRGW